MGTFGATHVPLSLSWREIMEKVNVNALFGCNKWKCSTRKLNVWWLRFALPLQFQSMSIKVFTRAQFVLQAPQVQHFWVFLHIISAKILCGYDPKERRKNKAKWLKKYKTLDLASNIWNAGMYSSQYTLFSYSQNWPAAQLVGSHPQQTQLDKVQT